MIGNNFASFRSDDQPRQGSYTGRNYSPENNQGTGNVQEGMSPIHHDAPFMTGIRGWKRTANRINDWIRLGWHLE